ncbi:hypothetical protein ABIA38_003796 [Embleya sp. AB8]
MAPTHKCPVCKQRMGVNAEGKVGPHSEEGNSNKLCSGSGQAGQSL